MAGHNHFPTFVVAIVPNVWNSLQTLNQHFSDLSQVTSTVWMDCLFY